MLETDLKGKRAIIVSSAGGHLFEAMLLSTRLELSRESIFITHDNPQTRSLLENHRHEFIPRIDSRDLRGAIFAIPKILKILRKKDFDIILSTGAAIAVSAVPAHLILKKSFYYFESLTRVNRPSMSGRIISLFPTIHRFSSNAKNFGSKWLTSPSLLDVYEVKSGPIHRAPLKILVTLGTIPNYRFDRIIDEVLRVIEDGDEVLWQLGCTARSNLPGKSYETIPGPQLLEMAKESDLVISHCGIGTILELLSNGICPLVMPRSSDFNEHVDNHQLEAVLAFLEMNLITLMNPTLTRNDLFVASSKYVE